MLEDTVLAVLQGTTTDLEAILGTLDRACGLPPGTPSRGLREGAFVPDPSSTNLAVVDDDGAS